MAGDEPNQGGPDDGGADAEPPGEALHRIEVRPPGPVSRRISMATRLAFSVLAVTIVSLVLTSVTSLGQGQRLGTALAEARLEAVRSSQVAQIRSSVRQATEQTAALASSPTTVEAIERFTAAYDQLADLDPATQQEQSSILRDYYRDEAIPALEEVRGRSVSTSQTLPATPQATYLQVEYIAESPAAEGREGSVDDAGDGSQWSAVHRELHPLFRDTARLLAAGDLYLVSVDGDVVYTTAKRVDLGTNLDVGPLSGSTLATLLDEVRADPTGQAVRIADLAPYGPALDEPVGFVGSPVLDGDQLVGMAALELPIDDLNELTTNEGDWASLGLGETGETYVVADDGTMRSDARLFVEDEEAYLDQAVAAGTLTPEAADAIEATGTTALNQPVNPDTVRAALDGEGLEETSNYLGETVVSSYVPLEIEGLDWALVAEVERDELEEPIAEYGQEVLIAIAVFVVVLTFLATIWAGRLTGPLRAISVRLRRVVPENGSELGWQGVADAVAREEEEGPDQPITAGETATRGAREFVALSESFDRMLTTLRARRRSVLAAHDERVALLRRFLPPAVARRVEEGDRDVLDQIPRATVVAVTVRGLGRLVTEGTAEQNRQVLESTLGELDAHAADHGLERVKLTGDTYFATCGVAQPFLDHGPRAVRFALAVQETLPVDDPGRLSVTAGVHTGPVTVGLSGSSLLVYDTWGPTVSRALQISRAGEPGQVLVSETVRAQLPESFAVERSGRSEDEPVWRVTGLVEVEEVGR